MEEQEEVVEVTQPEEDVPPVTPQPQQIKPAVVMPVIALEQCGICSAHYEQGRRTFAQPDVNRMVVKLLDAVPPSQSDGTSFLNSYIPTCTDCVRKVKRYDKIRMELEVLRREVVSSVVDTLLHIRPNQSTPLTPIKSQVLQSKY